MGLAQTLSPYSQSNLEGSNVFNPAARERANPNTLWWVVDQYGRLSDVPMPYVAAKAAADRYAANLPNSDVELVAAK